MAALYAKENKLNDCLVLNTSGNIADSTIANVFVIKDGMISTPGIKRRLCKRSDEKVFAEKMLQDAGYKIRGTIIYN